MELTPDIMGRSAGHSQFVDPWFDKDHDGDLASRYLAGGIEPPESAVATRPPRTPPRSVPPLFDSTFAMPRQPQSEVETRSPAPMPEAALRRGNADTLLSAAWFHDASDAAEWRAVAEERRGATQPAPAAPARIPMWIAGAVVASLVMLAAAGAGAVTIAVSALVFLT